ncbi:MAG TPA: trypsin-like peptidase domain-containing protein [Nitrososphaerales archaeon]|nr:trypsin-like peptidase domain-containing protein [Nitrososphaerales archaeon]
MGLTELESQITGAVERLSESVVEIDSTRLATDYRFGVVPVEGQGSGVIIDARGMIVTNNHVIDESTRVQVNLKDGRTFVGEVVGTDPATDVALVKINGENLPFATLGDSEKLKVGQIVLAIGNALGLPGAPTVSMGLIGALGRPLPGTDFVVEGLIQTDAAINPGNSGGPLADLDGKVIGMNTAMIPFAQGMGFAIPSETIKRIMDQISRHGRVVRPWLGISGMDVNKFVARRYNLPVEQGVLLAEVLNEGPARDAGLRVGDIVAKIGDSKVEGMKDLVGALSHLTIGDEVSVQFVRNGTSYETKLRLRETPEKLVARRR